MPQNVGTVYLGVAIDSSKVAGDLQRQMGAAGAAGGTALTGAVNNKLLAFGTQATRIGRQLSFGISAPLGAIGHAAETAFVAFDTGMTKVAALTGVGADQTKAWSKEVLDLASQFGVTGEDAAAALYLITSSGIKGAAAMELLKISVEAQAIGLGTSATIAGLLTSAINAYGEANLPAARAADILTGAVKASKIPADALAGSIGNLLPFGAKLGIGFDQITGAMAALSLQGTGAAQAATQLRGIFNGLLQPSSEAAQALTRIGLSAEQVRATFKDKGILAGLQQIQEAIVKSGQEADTGLAEMFGNVRALTGALGLLNDEDGKIKASFDNAKNSAGDFNAALKITTESAGFKSRQAVAGMHNELIALGEDIAPLQTTFLGVARGVVGFVNALGPAKEVLVTLGFALTVLGPLAYSIGAIADVAGLASGAYTALGAASATSAAAQVAASTAVAATEAAVVLAEEAVVTAKLEQMAASITAGGVGVVSGEAVAAAEAELVVATEAATAAQLELAAAETAAGAAAVPLLAALAPVAIAAAGIGAAIAIWNVRMGVAKDDAAQLGAIFDAKVATGGLKEANDTYAKTAQQIKELSDEVENSKAPWDKDYRDELVLGINELVKHADAMQAEIQVAGELSKATGQTADTSFRWLQTEKLAGRTYKTSDEALAAYKKTMSEHGVAVVTATTETGKLQQAAADLSKGFFGVQAAAKSYKDSVDKIGDAQRKIDDAARATQDAQRSEADAVQGVADATKAAAQDQADAIAKVDDARQRHADDLVKITDAEAKYQDSLRKVTDAQNALTEAQKTYNDLLAGPSQDEKLDVRSAELGLKRAQARLRGKFTDPLDKEQAAIDLERAQMSLTEAKGAHAANLAKAGEDVTHAQAGVVSAQKDAADGVRSIQEAEQAAVLSSQAIQVAQAGVADAAVKGARDIEQAKRAQEDAHRKVIDAQTAEIDAHDAFDQAQLDSATAADALQAKQNEFADAVAKSNVGLAPLTTYLDQLKGLYPEAAGGLQVYLDRAKELQAFIDASKPQPAPPPPEPEFHQAPRERAYGGPLAAGQLSTVNERGMPEMWTQGGKTYLLPVKGGKVTPLDPADLPTGGGGGAGVNVGDIHVYGQTEPVSTAYELRRQIRAKTHLAGRR